MCWIEVDIVCASMDDYCFSKPVDQIRIPRWFVLSKISCQTSKGVAFTRFNLISRGTFDFCCQYCDQRDPAGLFLSLITCATRGRGGDPGSLPAKDVVAAVGPALISEKRVQSRCNLAPVPAAQSHRATPRGREDLWA